MHTVQKGDISKQFVIAKLLKNGFKVLQPLTENSRYDLVVDLGIEFKRIQVKTIYYSNSKKRFEMNCYSSLSNTRHAIRRIYNSDDVDFLIGYNPTNEDLYIFPIQIVGNRTNIGFKDKWGRNQFTPLDTTVYKNSFDLIK